MRESSKSLASRFKRGGPERLIAAAKKVLEKTGVELADRVLAQALKGKGCRMSGQDRVTIPGEVVDQALGELEKGFHMQTVSGKRLQLDGTNRYYGSLTVDPYIVRYGQAPRPPMLEDVARHARIGDWLERIDSIYRMDIDFSDARGDQANLRSLQAFMSNTTTTYFCAPANMTSARYWVEMSEIMAGGSLKDKAILSGYVDTKSPLHLGAEGGKMLRYLLDHHVPVRSGPCPMAGATSPFSLAGTLGQSLAEVLFFIVACWAYRPDAKVVLGAGLHSMNMVWGQAWYFGPVKDLLHAATTEVFEHLGLPIVIGYFSSGPLRADFRCGFETVMSAFLPFFRRVDLFTGLGSLGNACGFSPELLLWQAEMLAMLEWLSRPIDCSGPKLALEAIDRVGPRGQFMDDALTLELLRTAERYHGEIFDYEKISPDQDWMALASAKADWIMTEHKPAVPPERLEALDRYVRDHLNGG